MKTLKLIPFVFALVASGLAACAPVDVDDPSEEGDVESGESELSGVITFSGGCRDVTSYRSQARNTCAHHGATSRPINERSSNGVPNHCRPGTFSKFSFRCS
jgi:hypothetical protein